MPVDIAVTGVRVRLWLVLVLGLVVILVDVITFGGQHSAR